MCTRYYIEPETEELEEIIAEVRKSPLTRKFIHAGNAVLTSGEIRPTNVVPVIASNKAEIRAVFPMRWGFRIPGRPPLLNARTETADEKPTFKEAWERRRCIVPASWYYEWEHLMGSDGKKKTGFKYMIQPMGSRTTWLCGLYRIEEGFPAFTVLTREPTAELLRIHDRMPLILPKELAPLWIRPETKADELLKYALTDMVIEKAVEHTGTVPLCY